MDKQIIKMMLNKKITIEHYASMDGRGKTTYSDPKVLACSISGERKMVRNEQGEEVVSEETLYFNANEDTSAIRHKDRITMPDGRQPPIIAVRPFYGEKGRMDLVEVNL
jgi:hypothetical protein